MSSALREWARAILPLELRRKLSRMASWPPAGRVRFGSLRRVKPISRQWGADRGTPIDRHYIMEFLSQCSLDVRGQVLEVGASLYAEVLGGVRVTGLDVLHVEERMKDVTVIGDLTDSSLFPPGTFDCIILTQTLPFIFEAEASIRNCHFFLKPGGVLLITAPGISKISREDMEKWGHFWGFTTRSMEELLNRTFPSDDVVVTARGNVLTAISFLQGLASEELKQAELEYHDPDYQVLITARASKSASVR